MCANIENKGFLYALISEKNFKIMRNRIIYNQRHLVEELSILASK